MTTLKPITGYPGGKQRYKKQIIEKFPKDFDTYYEPFIGMGAVFLELQPKKAIISDINPDIINIWKQIKNNPDKLIVQIEKYPNVNKKIISSINKKINSYKILDIKRASMYLTLMAHCYGNIIINNPNETITANYFIPQKPNGHYNRLLRPKSLLNFSNISKYLNNNQITIKTGSFEKILKKIKKTI